MTMKNLLLLGFDQRQSEAPYTYNLQYSRYRLVGYTRHPIGTQQQSFAAVKYPREWRESRVVIEEKLEERRPCIVEAHRSGCALVYYSSPRALTLIVPAFIFLVFFLFLPRFSSPSFLLGAVYAPLMRRDEMLLHMNLRARTSSTCLSSSLIAPISSVLRDIKATR